MICPKCKKDFEKGVKAAYKLGRMDGRDAMQETLNCLAKTHHELFYELKRLDRVFPLVDAPGVVILKVSAAKRILKALNKKTKPHDRYYAKTIVRDALTIQCGRYPELVKELVRMDAEKHKSSTTS